MKILIIFVLCTLYVHAQSDWKVAQEDLKKLAEKENKENRVDIIKNTVKEMKSEKINIEELRFGIYKLFNYGKESVPFLLEASSDTTIMSNLLVSPFSSLEITDHIRRGSLFLYLINYIVEKDTLIVTQRIPVWLFNNYDDYLYFRGVLLVHRMKRL